MKSLKSMEINKFNEKSIKSEDFQRNPMDFNKNSMEIRSGSLPAGLRDARSSPAGLQLSKILKFWKIDGIRGARNFRFSAPPMSKKCFGLDGLFRSPWFKTMLNFLRFSIHHHRMNVPSPVVPGSRRNLHNWANHWKSLEIIKMIKNQ